MACPDQDAIARLKSLDGDPEVIRHLKDCPSCWLDWQILHGTRHALYPPGEVRPELVDRAMARITQRAEQLGKPTSRWELAVSGILVAVATAAVLLTGPTFVPSVVTALVSSFASAVATVLFLQKRDENRRAVRGSRPEWRLWRRT